MIRDDLARFAAELSCATLPAPVVAAIKRSLVDHVASMLAGPRAFAAELPDLRGFVREQGGRGEATVIGLSGRYPASAAALTNTALGFTGIDAWHKPTALHVPAALFSATIAVAERERASGRELLAALAAGTETMIRVGDALGARGVYERGFHPTSVCGPFGCAVAAGSLLGLDARRMAEALSIAAVQCAGSSVWTGARAPATFCIQLGRAAQSGVLAAELAARGCTGIDRIFEDSRGFLAAYSSGADPAKLTAGLGDTYHGTRLMMQRFWFGPYLLTSIEVLIALMREEGLIAADIDGIEARIPTACVALVGAPDYPENRLATITSLRYALAVMCVLREEALYSMEVSAPACLADPEVRALFAKARVRGDDELDRLFPGTEPCILELRIRDGRTLTRRFDGPVRGDPDNPLSDDDLKAKLLAMATPALGPDNTEQVVEAIRGLERIDDVNDLTSLWAV